MDIALVGDDRDVEILVARGCSPFTTETRHVALDRPAVYLGLLAVAIGGLAVAIIDLIGGDAQYSLTPMDAPGLWLAIVAMAITTWGVLELFAEKPPAP